ncbi:ATP-dependent protease ATPase subunit HslU [Pectinatus brassicae]|uniref:ATP-dependent protease ATPase subunit HslU n=1 Tax=Pectinatus brassicae TaxID=862415 RepID=A0A840UYB4_9FIRM|nr:ATP-dependent protease ATPase subunit HslU [Pectinatus brassicae]MBB5337365.1 ATP-dependent HslUV protease ATP-binding subunit HslU [Pectinatus brassicae]
MSEQTPRQIVNELDKYIVGQDKAKRAVAVALRNRWRAQRLSDQMKDEVIPKNILMIGATGVGKTEIARRLAKLVDAPFVKVEATKFTEVGYVGRDVESMIRDLAEISVRMVKQKKMAEVQDKAKKMAEERILDLLVPEQKNTAVNPVGALFSANDSEESADDQNEKPKYSAGREFCRKRLTAGALEQELVEVDIEDNNNAPMVGMFAGAGMEDMTNNIQDMLGNLFPKKRKKRKVTIEAARKIFEQEEAQKLIDMDEVSQQGIKNAETNGIVFLDEIDKIAVKGGASGPDVSREGVQRDILPIVEGSTVVTKYGTMKTDHILFIAAGAFHMAKPSDLVPELQGRFPIRVELTALTQEDFKRILTEPQNALIKQYAALLATEDINIEFTDAAIEELARIACEVNAETENIGARRLHTIMEKLLEDLSFTAPDLEAEQITIDPEYIEDKLGEIVANRDLSRYIL